MISEPLYQILDFNIDRYVNPFIPRNYIYLLPRPIAHFLGWREKPPKEPPATVQWLLTIVSTIAGLLVVGAVFNFAPGLQPWNPPPMIASLGAAAILEFNAVRSPFAQPRNAIVGHTLSGIVAVGVAKLFMLAPGFYAQYMWIASIIACAAASVVMSMTNTIHPPGGAAAILACVDAQIIELGWTFPALILIGTLLILPVAFLFNNTLRQFPVFWWTPDEVGSKLYRKGRNNGESDQDVEDSDIEKGKLTPTLGVKTIYESDSTDSERTLAREHSQEIGKSPGLGSIHIAPDMIRIPSQFDLTEAESETLRGLMLRLRTQLEASSAGR